MPALAKALAMPSPMPEAPPVMKAVRPWIWSMDFLPVSLSGGLLDHRRRGAILVR